LVAPHVEASSPHPSRLNDRKRGLRHSLRPRSLHLRNSVHPRKKAPVQEHPRVRAFLVIGDTETARRACASLTQSGCRLIHLHAPNDAELRDALDRAVDGVAVLLWDDIAALRYCLAVHHIRPATNLFVTIFDATVRRQLQVAVPDCTIMSTADIAVPSLLGPSVDDGLAAIYRDRSALVGAVVHAETVDPQPYTIPRALRRRARLGVLFGQLRPHDGHSQMLLGGMLAMAVVLIADAVQSIAFLGMHPLEAFHTAARTLATVGPAEPATGSSAYALGSSIVMLVAVAATAVFTAGLVQRVVSVRTVGLLGRLALPRRGHVVVVGLGQVGLRLCQELRRAGLAVVAVERSVDSKQVAIARALRIPVVIGDGTSRRVLENAALRRAHALAAVASDDIQNISVAVTARAVAPHVRIVLRAGDNDAIAETISLFAVGHVQDVSGIAGEFIAAALLGERPRRAAGDGHDVFVESAQEGWHKRAMAKRQSCVHG
jgi:Trk K+ transport system NAD-binding subunit